jgi:hypothetical protein
VRGQVDAGSGRGQDLPEPTHAIERRRAADHEARRLSGMDASSLMCCPVW